jgi:hypothetical protein
MTRPATPATPANGQTLDEKLAQELRTMRDALTTLSLCLNDWRFELDQPGRQSAREQINAVLTAMRQTSKQRNGPDTHQQTR